MKEAPPDTITISRFKATCLAVLERVRATGRVVYVTKRGELIAEIVPPSPASLGRDWLGSMKGSAKITGDLVAPATRPADWDALRK
jgi:prevent-host-death family protein